MSVCRRCGREIFWATTRRGKKIPLDPEPDPLNGRVYLYQDEAIVLRPRELDQARKDGEPLFVAHFATCHAADVYHKGRGT